MTAKQQLASKKRKHDILAGMAMDHSLAEVLKTYYEGWSAKYRQQIDDLTNEVVARATPALKKMLEQETIAQIIQMPVAAAQEKELLKTLMHYVDQVQAPTFAIVVSCNWPAGSDRDAVAQTLQTVREFQQKYPHIALGMYAIEYPRDIKMGTIQKHLADTAVSLLLCAKKSSGPGQDTLLISHGADIVTMEPDYLKSMHEAFTCWLPTSDVVTWVVGNTSHALPTALPNLNKLVQWYDFRVNQSGGYELGMAVSTRAYVAAGGLRGDSSSRSWTDLCQRIHGGVVYGHAGQRFAEAAVCTVSPRRLHYRLHEEGAQLHDMWVSGTFGAHEAYRDYATEEDLPDETCHSLLRRFIADHGLGLFALMVERLIAEGGWPLNSARKRALSSLEDLACYVGSPTDLLQSLRERVLD